MNKTNMIILALIGIIVVYYVFTGKKIVEGFGGMGISGVENPKDIVAVSPTDPSGDPDPTSPGCVPELEPVAAKAAGCPAPPPTSDKLCPGEDPNQGLIKTCSNLVTNYANQCTANAAGIMTKAFGTKTTITPPSDKCHEHATDKKLLDFLRNMASKLSSLSSQPSKSTCKGISLDTPQARRGMTPAEYIQWKNVLSHKASPNPPPPPHPAQCQDGTCPTAPGAKISAPKAISGNENVVINVIDERSGTVSNGTSSNGVSSKKYRSKHFSSQSGKAGRFGQSSGQNGKTLQGSFGGGDSYTAYNNDDYI